MVFYVEGTDLGTKNGGIPYMPGYGGIKIILLPNNTVYYYFSDNFDNVWKKECMSLIEFGPFVMKIILPNK
ncbi:hypothetical protein [Christiangramia sp.]|uniref:hypothetical protein n=1 Tax=Christiangramia sp. TaxID=1931228 RepID=UPI0026165EF4|nr:hypothetical protein [Christiangramia sp.]